MNVEGVQGNGVPFPFFRRGVACYALRRKAHRGMKKTRYAFAVSQKLYIFVL